jgi:hypothetical protein
MELSSRGHGTVTTIFGRLLIGTAEKIPSPELVDTTGCGDAFIGAVLYGERHINLFQIEYFIHYFLPNEQEDCSA